MPVRKITEYPEKVLAEIGRPVTEFNKELEDLCVDMFDTMYDAEGVGLAAPQIGLNLRLFVMDCDGIKLIAANPEVIHTEGEQSGQEGCLSVGKVPAVVVRPLRQTPDDGLFFFFIIRRARTSNRSPTAALHRFPAPLRPGPRPCETNRREPRR